MIRANCLGPKGFGVYDVDLAANSFTKAEGEADNFLIPGLVDIHIHGAFGIDFMSASRAQMLELCDRLAEQGYEAFLPTTITAPADAVKRAIDKLPEHPMIAGFHLEGPFISRRYPGAQPPAYILSPAEAGREWDEIFDDPRLRVITLAPEQPGAIELIGRLSARGIICSIGHTDATFEQCQAAQRAGACHTTHTFNAMRPLHHREGGTVGFALTDDRVSTELIYDRLHVSPEVASLLIQSKPAETLVAVSDSSLATGMPPGEIEMWGHRCIIEPPLGDGSCAGRGQGEGKGSASVRIKESGALAGSAITLLDAFRNLAEDFGPEAAIRACCINPRKALLPPRAEEGRGVGVRGEGHAASTHIELDRDLQIIALHRGHNR